MGKHGSSQQGRGRAGLVPLISLVVLLLVAAGLGVWWWSLRSATDPIDAAPVDGYAVVVSSPACPGGGAATQIDIDQSGRPAVRSQISACGYREGARLAIQYLQGHPEQARLATGVTTSSTSSVRKWLPLGILLAGVLAVAATIVLLAERRPSRAGGTERRLTVAELRAQADSDEVGMTAQAPPAPDAESSPAENSSAEPPLAAAPAESTSPEPESTSAEPDENDDTSPTPRAQPDPARPAGGLPTGDVLFTHSGTEVGNR